MSATPDQATSSTKNSVQTFLTALVVNVAVVAVEVFAFTLLKTRYHRIYSPRSYLPPPDKRASELPNGLFAWFPAVLRTDPKQIIHKNGLDAYLFVRFLWILILIFGPFTLVTWAIIMPVDAVNIKGGSTDGLGMFTLGNIPALQQSRYAAHVIVAYLLTFYVIWLLRREMLRFVHLRHEFLISKSHSKLAQAKTVLITSLPDDLTTEADLRQFASFVPGGVARIWIYRDALGLNDLHKDRLAACKRLEKAESSYIRAATKAWRKQQIANGKANKAKNKEHGKEKESSTTALDGASPDLDLEGVKSNTPLSILQTVPRPTHRLGKIPLMGQEVDTIDWCKAEIPRLTASIEALRQDLPTYKSHGSAMIMCNLQMGAHVLAQCVSYHEPLKMVDKWIELAPEDVVWDNIDDGAYAVRIRYVISWALTIGLIVLWSFPVAFAGTLSQLDNLCVKLPWLEWLCKLHSPVKGIIQGVLPPLFLAILFVLLPIVLRALATYENIPRYSLISISVYKRYYLFLVIHGFLITTLSSGITNAISQIIDSPKDLATTLAHNLPAASTFFLTYVIANGFTAATSAMLQLVPLLLHFITRLLFGNTPRQAYKNEFLMPKTDFGTTLPRISLLATIALAYSVISPVICAIALIAFSLLLFAWKFLLTWVMDQPDAFETGGLYFPLAVSNLFVGLYVEQICLAILFFLNTSDQTLASSITEGSFMVLLIGITFGSQLLLRRAFEPITDYLPMSLATKKMAQKYARQQARTHHGIQELQNLETAALDLFSRDRVRSVVRRRIKIPGRHHSNHAVAGPSTIAEQTEGHPDHVPGPADAAVIPDRPPSVSSHMSHRSKASSKKSSKKTASLHLAPPAKALRDDDDGDESDDDDDVDEHAFDHPSTYQDAPWIWIPKDELGLSAVLLEELKAASVDASDVGATMDEKSHVHVDRNPPDEDWIGGHDV